MNAVLFWSILGSVGVGGGLLYWLIEKIKSMQMQKTMDSWEVGDMVKLKKSISSSDHGMPWEELDNLHKLLGWNKTCIFVRCKEITYKIPASCLQYNKSATWRENYRSCEEKMGTTPGFSASVGETKDGTKIDGKPIELLSEVECQVYLKQAIDTEEYELAEAIRKRMQSFR